MEPDTKLHDVVMVGAGPSALAAAVYTTREEIDTVLLEKGVVGGLAAITDWVDNYPGFTNGIEGLKLAEQLQGQAERFGADIRYGDVVGIHPGDERVVVWTSTGSGFEGRPGGSSRSERIVSRCAASASSAKASGRNRG